MRLNAQSLKFDLLAGVAKSYLAVCFNYCLSIAIFLKIDIS